MLHGTGIFTYMNGEKWLHSTGNGLVNIPVPWSMWDIITWQGKWMSTLTNAPISRGTDAKLCRRLPSLHTAHRSRGVGTLGWGNPEDSI